MELNVVDKKDLKDQDFNQKWNKERNKVNCLCHRVGFITTFHCSEHRKHKNKYEGQKELYVEHPVDFPPFIHNETLQKRLSKKFFTFKPI